MTLTSKRKGDIAEFHVASLLLTDPALEVFMSTRDDGHGSDLAVRSARTERWYSVQVKAAGVTANPSVALDRFRGTDDFLGGAVVLDGMGLPAVTLLIPGSAWATDESSCLSRNDDGGKAGGYVEVRTTGAKYQEALQQYRAEAMLGRL